MVGLNIGEEYLAYYMRLSVEDKDKKRTIDESDSIINQRALLRHYVEENPDLAEMKSVEFTDDGESGMNYERSAFKMLIDEVKKGTIKAIIVKDLSRFGRGYIDAADYLEQIFPFLGVRFISVNDFYDSKKHKYGTAGMIDVGFKQIMHQYYSVSLSQKITYAHNQLSKNGKYHASYAFYGYIKSDEKYKLIIDEETAAIVRFIFDSALRGKRKSDIAVELNNMGVPTPLQALIKHHKTVKTWREKSNRQIWNVGMIYRILKEERYTGAYIYGKTCVESVGSKKVIKKPKEEWIIVPDIFPVIIPKDIFDKVNPNTTLKALPKKNEDTPRMFYNVFCGYCGMFLNYNHFNNSYYVCQQYKDGVTVACKDNRVYEKDLMVLTLQAIKEEALKIKKSAKAIKRVNYKGGKTNQIKALQLKLKAIPSKKEKLFTALISGEITDEENAEQFSLLEQEESKIKAEITALQNTAEIRDYKTETKALIDIVLDAKIITEEMIKLFVKNIRVFANDRIEIIITLNPLNGQDEQITKVYPFAEIKGNRVWIYYRNWYKPEKLQEQRNVLVDYANSKSWKIIGESGDYHSKSRKLFKEITERAKNREFDILLVEDIIRFSKNPNELEEALETMRKYKVRVVAAVGTPYSTFLNPELYNEVNKQ